MIVASLTYEVALVEMRCGECDIRFAIPDYLQKDCRQTGRRWYCPNGHPRVYSDPENGQLRRQLNAARAQLTAEQDQRLAAERSAAAARGQVTKLRKRIVNGVCPCCKRTFADVARHMATKHPEEAQATA